MVTIFYESHGRSVDNERRVVSGHRDAPLAESGRRQAREMGQRHASREIAAVFSSDLLPQYDGAMVVIVDHTAVHLALEHWLQGVPLARAVAEDAVRPWQPE